MGLAAVTISYAGYKRWLNLRGIFLISLIPCIGTLLAWTNESHMLIWRQIGFVIQDGVALLNPQYGPFFYVYLFYNYCIASLSVFVFARRVSRTAGMQRSQSILVLVGLLLPWLGNLLYLSGKSPIPGLDLTLVGLTIGAFIVFWGGMDTTLLGISPIPRYQVVEDMADIVVLLDMRDRIIDVNPAASLFINLPRE